MGYRDGWSLNSSDGIPVGAKELGRQCWLFMLERGRTEMLRFEEFGLLPTRDPRTNTMHVEAVI